MTTLECILNEHIYQFDKAENGSSQWACIVCGFEVNEYEDAQP